MTELTGTVLRPDDPGYDAARRGFQAAHAHRPDVVVAARSADDVAAARRYATAKGLPFAVQSSGHGLAAPLEGGILVSTREMRGVAVDPVARTARIEAGASWGDVVAATIPHGLAPLNGSSPGVGVVGYLLGGGFGLLGRRYGFAVDRVRAVEGVTPAGEQIRTDLLRDDLVVTSVEIELVEQPEVWGGSLAIEATPELLTGWTEWAADLPETVTAGVSLVPFPDVEHMPPPFRGRHMAMLTIAATVDVSALVAPLRELGPVRHERLGTMPYAESHTIHNDPSDPEPYAGDAHLLRTLDPSLLGEVLDATGPTAAVPSVMEIRRLGGAFARGERVPAAFREASHLVRAVTVLGDIGPTEKDARALHERLFAPFATDDLGRARTFCYGATH
ncbi:FAD-binding oxidoreductase [Pseudonocardia ailaonensis]|uniref:FAD-binding oxidoreductase n=1 Tax=Pseudonocardia ailaonensis TaxID=367279 RepID=A0ABN2MM38_9PSEU